MSGSGGELSGILAGEIAEEVGQSGDELGVGLVEFEGEGPFAAVEGDACAVWVFVLSGVGQDDFFEDVVLGRKRFGG